MRAQFRQSRLRELQRGLFGIDRSFKLAGFNFFEYGSECRAWMKPEVHQIAARDEPGRAEPVLSKFDQFLLREVIALQIAVARQAVDPMKLEMFLEVGQAQEPFQG